jgi:hypothetical protein
MSFKEQLTCRLKGIAPFRCANCDLRFMVKLPKTETDRPESATSQTKPE